MVVLVCYDIGTIDKEGPRRLRRVADICENHGVRVQYSVFECHLAAAHWVVMRHELLSVFAPATDSLRFYFVNAKDAGRTEHHGARPPLDVTAALVL